MLSFAAKLSSFYIIKKKRKEFGQGCIRDPKIDGIPVVYIQRDKKNLYVGKSTDIYERFVAHISDEAKTFNEVIVLNYSPLNVLTDCLKWEIPANTDVSTSYLSRLYPQSL
ncbi:hypothetical protein P4280_28615, partial [Bacillus thuringiensis]|nr:hypothetical protein [Bacillus thuringiensis]